MKKTLAMFLVVALAVVSVGCGTSGNVPDNTGTGKEQATQGNTTPVAETGGNGKKEVAITVMVESGSPGESLANETAERFYEETGIKVNVDPIAYSGMYDKLSAEVQAGTAIHDVSTLDFIWLSAFANAITPITGADTSDFLPSLEQSGTVNGQLLGYPMWVNAKILIYRPDIFKELGLTVPGTQEEYLDTAKWIAENTNYKGNSLIGMGSDAVCTFCDFACQNGADSLIIDADGNCNLTNQEYVDALQYMLDLDKYGTGDSAASQCTEVQTYFENGDIIMELTWSHFYPKTVATLGADKVACAPMLAGSAGIGATGGPWYQCVMKNSANQEAALKYVQWMWEHNEDYMTTSSSLNIAASSRVYKEYGAKKGYEHLNAVLETLSGNALGRPLTVHWSQIEDILGSYIEAALQGQYTAQEAMSNAAEEIQAIIK
jgi:multiple sugar transport system substrate-binding protein